MQNWNQWPVPSGTVSAPMPPPPTGYTAPGTDPMATMQAYMQYYNQPAPSGYTTEQWASAQQQNWAQWQQWQQQYQQWQAQYGEKYQETMKQYGVTGQQAPPLPLTSQPPPPPPKDDKPPLPPSGNISSYGYSTSAPPPPPATNSNITGIKRASGSETEMDSAKKIKESDEELSEAEKTFDAQFKQWEEKFNTWKLQNANHPDKTQYKQYEAKWTSWREKLIERREQMRRKREQQKLAAAAKAETEKKDMPGGDKILNILSSTENQGLINNLLGIGKTLGLTTKQDQATVTSTASIPIASTVPMQQQPMVPPQVAMTPMMQPDMSQAWAQWNQYNPTINTSMPPMSQPMSTQMSQYNMQHIPMTAPPPHHMPPPNFSQPPPGFPPANFSQPPPGFTQPPPPLNTNPPPPPVSQPPININLQQLSKAPPPPLGTVFGTNQLNQQRGIGKDNNSNDRFGSSNINSQFRQGTNEDNQSNNFSNRGNRSSRGTNRNNFNQGNRTDDFNQGNRNDFNRGNDNDNRFTVSNRSGNFGRNNQDNFDDNYENRNVEYDAYNYNNNRFMNRQQQEDNMPPELKKLMAKRKTVTDVFKPSSSNFGLDSSTNTSSLSESFKKVSGDKGFGKGVNFREDKFGPKFRTGGFEPSNDFNSNSHNKSQDIRGSNEFGNDSTNNFGNKDINDCGNNGPNNFGNRCQNNFGNRNLNNYGNRGSNNFGNRGSNNFGNRSSNDFGNRVFNKEFGNKDISNNQDQNELSTQIQSEILNFNQVTNFANKDIMDTNKDQSRNRNFSDKSSDFEKSTQNFLENKFECNKDEASNNFNNVSEQKGFLLIEDKASTDFVSNKNSFCSIDSNQILTNFDIPPPLQLQKESEFVTEFQCSEQASTLSEHKLDIVDNEQLLHSVMNEKDVDITKDKMNLIVEDISSLTKNFIESKKDSNNQEKTSITESTETINPMLDESAWIPCENETNSNIKISNEADISKNEHLNEICIIQDDNGSKEFNVNIDEQKSDTLPFMGIEDPKAEDMNLQLPPEQPNVAMITTLEEPPTPVFTDEIIEEDNFENKNSDKTFLHTLRNDFNHSNFNEGSFSTPPSHQSNTFGRQEQTFKSGQFNTAPPSFGQRGNFRQTSPGPSGSKSTIPSLLTLKIDPPPMMMVSSRSAASDDDLFESDEKFKHNKSFDTDTSQSNVDNNFNPGSFGFNKSSFNKDGSVDKDRNFNSGNFCLNKSLFGKDGSIGLDRKFNHGSSGSNNFSFIPEGSINNDRNFGSGLFNVAKAPFNEDNKTNKDRIFVSGSFGSNKAIFSQDGSTNKDRNFRSGSFNQSKLPFVKDESLSKGNSNLGSGLNISSSNELSIEGKNTGSGVLGVVSNTISSNSGINESSSVDPIFAGESNHQNEELTLKFNESKKDFNEESINNNDLSNNSELLDIDKNLNRGLFISSKHSEGKKSVETDTNFNPDVYEFEKLANKDICLKNDVNQDSSSFRHGISEDNRKFSSSLPGSIDTDNRNFESGHFSSSLQKFSVGNVRNRQSFDFQVSFNSSRSDDAPLISPNKTSIDIFDKGVCQFEKSHSRFDKPVSSFDNSAMSDKSSGFSLVPRRGINNDYNSSGPEFCVGKQFNYNHGGIPQDKSLDFLAPTKVIDYSHETRCGVFEFVEPVGIYDYGHGKLKPSVPDIIQDFKNWEETEHNLVEYNEEMRKRSEKVGRMWTSPSRSIEKSLWDDPKPISKDKKERNDNREIEKDRDDRRRDKDRDDRRDRDREERLNDRLRDKDRSREKDRDDRYIDRNRSDKDRDDRYRDNDRYNDRSRDKDRDDRYRISDRDRDRSRDKDRDDRYKDREDRYKDRDDRYKDREDRYKERGCDKDKLYDKDREERYKDRDDRYKDRVDKNFKDKSFEKDLNKNLEKDLKDRSLEKDLNDKISEKDLKDKCFEKDRSLEKDTKDKNFEKDREDKNSEKDKDFRIRRDKPAEQKEDDIIVEKCSTSEKYKEQEEKGNKSKDVEKNDDRSKGNISWQDSTAIISADTTPVQDSSLSEIKQNALEIPPKIMELPKTPNLTMVDDILCTPGRLTRPPKIAIILRGPPGSGKSFVAKLIKDKEIAQGGSAPRILSIDDYFLVEKDSKPSEDSKKDSVDEMEYKYEEAMEPEYVNHLFKAFKKNITDGFFNFIVLDSINEKISDYEEMWSFAKTKGFKVYVCEMEMDVQICLKRNIHKRSEDEINRIVDYFEPAPSHHHKLDVTALLQEQAIEDVEMEDVQNTLKEEIKEKERENEQEKECVSANDDSQDSQEDVDETGVSKWEKMEAEDKLDRLDGLKRKHDNRPQTIEEFLQVPDYYDMEDNSGKKHVRWADLEERKQQEKMRAVGFVVGQTNWNRMMDPTHGGSALTRTKYI